MYALLTYSVGPKTFGVCGQILAMLPTRVCGRLSEKPAAPQQVFKPVLITTVIRVLIPCLGDLGG